MPKVILQDVRGSFVFVTEPRKEEDGSDGKYGVQILLPKDDPQVKKLKKAIKQALVEKHGENAANRLAKYKLPLRDGDEERNEDGDQPEYEGMYFMNANSARKPGIVNRNNEPADPIDLEEYCYSGAYFHVSVSVYGYDSVNGSKPGVALGLNNIMLRKKGERLDGSVSATSEFSDYASDDMDDDFDDDDDL